MRQDQFSGSVDNFPGLCVFHVIPWILLVKYIESQPDPKKKEPKKQKTNKNQQKNNNKIKQKQNKQTKQTTAKILNSVILYPWSKPY